MSPAASPQPPQDPTSSKPRGLHPGWVIAGFFAILMAFNISFIVIAVQHPPKLVPRAAPGDLAAPPDHAPLGAHEAASP